MNNKSKLKNIIAQIKDKFANTTHFDPLNNMKGYSPVMIKIIIKANNKKYMTFKTFLRTILYKTTI